MAHHDVTPHELVCVLAFCADANTFAYDTNFGCSVQRSIERSIVIAALERTVLPDKPKILSVQARAWSIFGNAFLLDKMRSRDSPTVLYKTLKYILVFNLAP
jgi:hypothetical protein